MSDLCKCGHPKINHGLSGCNSCECTINIDIFANEEAVSMSEFAALRSENEQMRAALDAAKSIHWMAREYAEAGGSSGPEMREYEEAVRRSTLASVKDGTK